jgi:hypothetical protein
MLTANDFATEHQQIAEKIKIGCCRGGNWDDVFWSAIIVSLGIWLFQHAWILTKDVLY